MVEEPRPDEKGVQKDSLRRGGGRLSQEDKWVRTRVSIVVLTTIILILLVILLSVFDIVTSDYAVVVGAVLALVGVLITQMVNTFNAREAQKHQQKLEDQRAQDDALQKYLDQVSDSETYKNLRTAKEEGYKRAVMLAKMKTLLLALDGGRKSILLLFLNEAKLVKKSQYLRSSDKKGGWNYPILELEGIDFSGAKLDHSIEVDFADLSGANLSNTDLSGATLGGVNLRDADLSGSNLSKAKLLTANQTKLLRTEGGEAEPDYPERVGPIDELLKMDLSRANLRGADLTEADLTGADLTEAVLTGANLSGANLFKAVQLTKEQLQGVLGDENTKLPSHLKPPAQWNVKTDEQPEEN